MQARYSNTIPAQSYYVGPLLLSANLMCDFFCLKYKRRTIKFSISVLKIFVNAYFRESKLFQASQNRNSHDTSPIQPLSIKFNVYAVHGIETIASDL